MVIAMITVRVVQPSIDQVVDVLTVRYRLMPATRAVDVTGATGIGSAMLRIGGVDRELMLVHVVAVHVMHVAVVEIIHMPVVPHRGVPAFRAVLVGVIRMMGLGTGGHGIPFLLVTGPTEDRRSTSFVKPEIRHCSRRGRAGVTKPRARTLAPAQERASMRFPRPSSPPAADPAGTADPKPAGRPMVVEGGPPPAAYPARADSFSSATSRS